MKSGSFGVYGQVQDLSKRIRNFVYPYESQRRQKQLRGAIQVKETFSIKGLPAISGYIIDEYIDTISTLVDGDVGPEVNIEEKVLARFTGFVTIGNGLLFLDNGRFQENAFRIMSQAMAGRNDFVTTAWFDLDKIYKDYKGHWMDSIGERQGNWTAGTLYGNELENDGLVGPELARSAKRRVGFYSDYFTSKHVKVAVTRNGNVTVWATITRDEFLEFVLDELKQYIRNAR